MIALYISEGNDFLTAKSSRGISATAEDKQIPGAQWGLLHWEAGRQSPDMNGLQWRSGSQWTSWNGSTASVLRHGYG